MWEIDIKSQLLGFLYFCCLGAFFCLLYDVLRAVRRVKDFSSNDVFLQDILYFLVITPITFCFLLSITNGQPRAYTVLGLIIGFIVWRVSFSRLLFKVLTKLFEIIFKLLSLVKRLFHSIFSEISILACKTKEIYKKILKNVVKDRKKA